MQNLGLTLYSFRCLAVIGSVLGRAGEAGQKRRLEAAQKGIVKWETAAPIRRFQDSELTRNQWRRRAIAENKAEEAQALGVEGVAAPAAPEDELSIRQAMRELDDEDMLDLLQGEASDVEGRGPGQKYEA